MRKGSIHPKLRNQRHISTMKDKMEFYTLLSLKCLAAEYEYPADYSPTMSGNKWVYVRETLQEILNSNSFNCFVDLEWHFGRALTCLHFHRGKGDLNDLQHHGSPCFVPRSLSGTGTLLRRSPLVINRCNRANVFLQHNSAIVFNAWLSFWHTHAVFTNIHTSPSSPSPFMTNSYIVIWAFHKPPIQTHKPCFWE